MRGKHWRLEVSELGASGVLFESVVTAPTWLAALQSGRSQMGEAGGIPQGASCNVAPNGIVMIQDARARRRYRIVPTVSPPAPIGAAAPQQDGERVPAEPRTGIRHKSSLPPPVPIQALGRTSGRPRPSSPPVTEAERKMVVIASRDEEPSAESPIHFRERMYAIPGPAHPGTAEKLATKMLNAVKTKLRHEPHQKFVRIEIYDHTWTTSPRRRPVVRLEWKSWHTAVDIAFPLEASKRSPDSPRTNFALPPREDRLKASFEACRDLMFLQTRAQALEFGVRLLEELIAPEAAAACVFDINTDEFRFVAARGRGADQRTTRAIPSTDGLFGAAARLNGRSLLELADATKDPRFDMAVDGIPALDVRAVVYRPLLHDNQLYGVLQLANGVGTGAFTRDDCKVIDYVAQRLGEFCARTSSQPPPAN